MYHITCKIKGSLEIQLRAINCYRNNKPLQVHHHNIGHNNFVFIARLKNEFIYRKSQNSDDCCEIAFEIAPFVSDNRSVVDRTAAERGAVGENDNKMQDRQSTVGENGDEFAEVNGSVENRQTERQEDRSEVQNTDGKI